MHGRGRGFGPHCGLPYYLMKISPSPASLGFVMVRPDHTLRLADRLIAADKDFELLIVPRAEHTFIDCLAYIRKRCWDFLVREITATDAGTPHESHVSPGGPPGALRRDGPAAGRWTGRPR